MNNYNILNETINLLILESQLGRNAIKKAVGELRARNDILGDRSALRHKILAKLNYRNRLFNNAKAFKKEFGLNSKMRKVLTKRGRNVNQILKSDLGLKKHRSNFNAMQKAIMQRRAVS